MEEEEGTVTGPTSGGRRGDSGGKSGHSGVTSCSTNLKSSFSNGIHFGEILFLRFGEPDFSFITDSLISFGDFSAKKIYLKIII